MNQTSGTSPKDKPPASPLFEVAKKWKDAKNKLVLKDKLFSQGPMLGTSGSSSHSSGGDQFEFKDENFRSRRRELTEKAKALKDITTASNNQEVVVVGVGDKVAAVNDAVDVEDDAEAAAVVEAGAAATTAVVVVVKEDETAI